MGGHSDNSAQNQSNAIAQQQASTGADELALAKQRMAQADETMKPATDFWKSIASGDYKTMVSAAGIPIANITQANKATEANTYNNVPAGAGRDYALAAGERDKNNQLSSTLNQLYTSSFPALTQIGAAQQGVSLQQTGAGLSAYSGAAATSNNVMQAQAAQQQAKASIYGSIFGGLGSAAGGYLSKH